VARRPQPPPDAPAALVLARQLQAVADKLPGHAAEPVRERPGGIVEANASFEVRDVEGRAFTVIVARTH
jgi:hypothetical protein